MDDTINTPIIKGDIGYNPDKTYALYVNPANRHIAGMIGFLGPIESISDGRNFETHSFTDLTEQEYTDISRSINSHESFTFLDSDNRTIISRRIMVDLLDNTFYDTKIGMIYGVNNEVKLRIRCIDNTSSTADDVTAIEVKNIKKSENPVELNGNPADVVKITISNPGEVTAKLTGTGVHALRIKAKIPGVDYLWLTVYPQLIKLNDEQLAALDTFIASRPV